MSIIYSYPETTSVTDSDLFILSKQGSKDTNTVKAENIKNYIASNTSGSWLTKEITITAAQLKDLVANPVEVLPAPGQDKSYNIIQMAWYMAYGTASFDFPTEAPKLTYADASVAAQTYSVGTSSALNNTSSYAALSNIAYGDAATGVSPSAPGDIGPNQALSLIAGKDGASTPTNATTGDGNLYLSIAYKIIDISSSIKAY
tara:strand:+ start:181 stop:786 length:606 start_codon:yes stop_codon:yes gene_type:complete